MAQINLRVDDDVKKNAEIVCNEIGISMAAAINIYLKALGRERRIPFEVTADPSSSRAAIEMTDDEKIDFIAKRILKEHHAAFEELAK